MNSTQHTSAYSHTVFYDSSLVTLRYTAQTSVNRTQSYIPATVCLLINITQTES
jgi:hypothetical protein